MPHQLIPKAAKWLREGGCIPPEDLKEISLNSTHIRMLMTAEVKRHGSPKVGTHWLLSDDMQDLLTRMIGVCVVLHWSVIGASSATLEQRRERGSF